ncbi:glycosyltransferase [Candidatus Peregrinibacteria bacterium]|nr:glycosyltransferase [Candidatus Peregrinibacteria bacterium]
MPAVSVCIPTYEPNPDHLAAAIESVFAQTFADWELIVRDDASETDVRGVVRPFLGDARVKFLRNDKRIGIGGNWNACARPAEGEFIAYLFQDDLWNPKYLERSVNILTDNPDIGFTAAQHSYRIEGATAAVSAGIYKEVDDARAGAMKEGRIAREDFLRMWIGRGLRPNLIGEPSFVVLRRSTIERAGPFLENMKQGLDSEYWMRCLLGGDAWWIVENSGEFRVHPSSATERNDEQCAGKRDRLRMFRILINALPSGEMKMLAKRALRRTFFGMAWKFVKRRLFRKM